jgi:membrane-associated phospholipid phosphatase
LPFVLPKFNNRKWITFLVIVPVSIVGLIAFGRILAGAHYMSDTIIGGTIPFLASFVGYWIFIQ